MNKAQKEVQGYLLDEEKTMLKWIEKLYQQASKDTAAKIRELSSRTDMENLQSIIYQKKYQEALKSQIDSTLNDLHKKSYSGISDYLNDCYESGYSGAMFDIYYQGIPIISPIDQKQVVKALKTDSKLSKGLYGRLGEDISYLKKSIRAEVSRGIVEGSSWNDVANKLSQSMKNTPFAKAKSNAMRIARTEGHRIQVESQMDACTAAKEKGADIVKQWDAALDGRTRDTHRLVDGEIREMDEVFSNGLMFPGDPSGDASEVCNCRCALLQRARWALDEDELETLQERADYFGLNKDLNFEEFKDKYLNISDYDDTIDTDKERDPSKIDGSKITDSIKDFGRIGYRKVSELSSELTESEIISKISGGDMTKGSCASAGLAYCGNKQGLDVLDFRGGRSLNYFSSRKNLVEIMETTGDMIKASGTSGVDSAQKLLESVESGKEYYLVTGKHASIVRKENDSLQYLELQSAYSSGWTNFKSNPSDTLKNRFGCSGSSLFGSCDSYMVDVDSFGKLDNLDQILGYLNTNEGKEKKGVSGYAK